MKRKTITVLFPDKEDLSLIYEKTADMARLLSPSTLRGKAAIRLRHLASAIEPKSHDDSPESMSIVKVGDCE